MRRHNQWTTVIAAMRKAMAVRAIYPDHSREGASGPLARGLTFKSVYAQSLSVSIIMRVLVKHAQLIRIKHTCGGIEVTLVAEYINRV